MRALFARGGGAASSAPAGGIAAAQPALTAGALTELRAAAVNNDRLAQRAIEHGIGRYLRYASAALHADMCAFAASAAAPDAPRAGGHASSVPKVLADALEAVVGAALLDAGMDLEAAWRVVEPLLALDRDAAALRHPVTALQEACAAARLRCTLRAVAPPAEAQPAAPSQGDGAAAPATPVPVRRGAAAPRAVTWLAVVGGVEVARGEGRNKKDAKRRAALAALAAQPLWPPPPAEARAL